MHYKDKNLQIDIRCHTVFMNDQKIELSLKEFTVLKYLTEHPGWVFSHEEIYRNVWKEEPIDCANAVMCCISQLRKKLKVDSRNWNYIRIISACPAWKRTSGSTVSTTCCKARRSARHWAAGASSSTRAAAAGRAGRRPWKRRWIPCAGPRQHWMRRVTRR